MCTGICPADVPMIQYEQYTTVTSLIFFFKNRQLNYMYKSWSLTRLSSRTPIPLIKKNENVGGVPQLRKQAFRLVDRLMSHHYHTTPQESQPAQLRVHLASGAAALGWPRHKDGRRTHAQSSLLQRVPGRK